MSHSRFVAELFLTTIPTTAVYQYIIDNDIDS